MKFAGTTLGITGLAMSGLEAYAGYKNGDSNTMNKGIAGTVVGGFTLLGGVIFGGPVVATAGLFYFIVLEPLLFESDKKE